MLSDFRIEMFQEHLGDPFQLFVPGGAELDLRLAEARALSLSSSPPGCLRAPFALLFHGPATPWVRQATYHLRHSGLGEMEIFLVPLGPDESGMRYEAIFT